MLSENLSYGDLKNFVRLGMKGVWPEGAGTVTIVNFAGVTLDQEGPQASRMTENENELDEYNDVTILARRHPKTGKGEIYASQGTVEPGKHYAVDKPHAEGAAYLCWGQHRMERYNRRKDGRLVLRGINNRTRFWRDPNKNLKQDLTDPVFTRAIGQWYHAMGTGESIGKWSAGCVGPRGGYDGEAWLTLLKWLKHHPTGKPIILTLWGFKDYCEFHMAFRHGIGPLKFRPILRKGIRDLTDYGPVRDLQTLLLKAGYPPGYVDGDWMDATQEAFLKFQREQGLTVDGICGEKSWSKLETLVYGG